MNISDFAKIAGVSKSAVSRYFNNGYLSEDKRIKIEKAIEKTGYSPSISARSVRTRVTKLVGVILPKLSSESCARVAEGISEVLDSEGYQLLLVNTANDCRKELDYLELFRQNRVDGVILLATILTDLHKSVLSKMHVPVVIVGQRLDGFNCVCHDDKGAAYALTKLMLDKDRRRPGYIGVTLDDIAAGKARWEGFKKAVSESGLDLPKKYIETAKFDIDSGYEKASRMLSGKDIPDCIFCATDNIAIGAMLCCKEKGLRIPEDVMISSIGDTKTGKAAYTPLTMAHFHYKTAGIDAAEMLLLEIKRGNSVGKILQLDYDIIERDSTGKYETV